MVTLPEDFLIETKYHPKSVDDVIAPKRIKNFIHGIVDKGNILSCTFKGEPGCGKTTIGVLLAQLCDIDYFVVDGSVNNGVDYIRSLEDMANTATTNDRYRLIIIDEADYLSTNAQAALRNIINNTLESCRWILTVNKPDRIIDALKDSRTPCIDFNYTQEEINEMSVDMWKRLNYIIKEEGWEIEDNKSLAKFMMNILPNIRLLVKSLQIETSSNGGRIPAKISIKEEKLTIDSFKQYITGNFETLRKFVSSTPQDVIIRFIYDNLNVIAKDATTQKGILTWLAHYQGQFRGIEEIYTTSLLMNMRDVFKK